MEKIQLTDNILELNRDMEPFIIQGSATRPKRFNDKYTPLQFVHFADVHNRIKQWNRLVEYINYYEKYIAFALHTGDYCGSCQEQYTDFYNVGEPCVKPIYNCLGNHDTYIDQTIINGQSNISTKEGVYKLLFNRTENWDAEFMAGEFSMTYYKDFPDSGIRIVVLDNYYDIDTQKHWLEQVLKDALKKELHVITATHELTDHICNPCDTVFHTLNDYKSICGKERRSPFEEVIVNFIKDGGIHVVHLAGHHHHDRFGYTAAGILNCAVECATSWDGWNDGTRVEGTRTFDCFNVVSVNASLGVFAIARIGDNTDHYLRHKQSLCFDYINKKFIYNG